ncbi:MAG: 16S rRNA (cytosine(1402)-N(4))-methyltransferase RsmH [Clostridia bacterium]|nr:16S rRNA (cytosine(1402)-N(4))-methyltransferase RsmH [Clostridia bacterium]
MEFVHIPVLLEECLSGLALKPDGVYFDGTLGGAGHSYQILNRTSPNGRLVATDLDTEAIAAATLRLAPFGGRFQIFHTNFKNYEDALAQAGVTELDGVLLDLGVSSYQLDNGDRGFAYMARDARLDMRMNTSSALSAYEVINGYSENELKRIFSEYGEERFLGRIAQRIVETRKNAPIETTGELVDLINAAIPAKFKTEPHPEKRVFQAVRIEVNGELHKLKETVMGLAKKLKVGGRIAVITFHSLEDRIVKQALKELEQDCICNKNLPVCVCNKRREVKILTNKPITASESELQANSRAKSAKLRIAERV